MQYIFATDLHGNISQYRKLLEFVSDNKVDVVFLGGDLWPKEGGRWYPENEVRTVHAQEAFIKDFFLQYIEELAENAEVFYILGNDDFAITQRLLEHNNERVHYLNGSKSFRWKGYMVIGYPYVGLTPYLQKDWESWDDFEGTVHKNYITQGYHSTDSGHVPADYMKPPLNSKYIADDLDTLFGDLRGELVIAVFHEAPYGRMLDVTHESNSYLGSMHLGSKSLIRAIQKYQPVISFHGHIHESFQESRRYWEQVGDTLMFNPGNGLDDNEISFIYGSLDNPDDHERITI
jgi:Icc-related predicted phosphoesterase